MIKTQTYAKLFLSACLSVSIVGCGGGSSSSGSDNNPPSATENVTAVNALVQSSNGSLLKGVTVTILGQKTTTNENGLAQFNVNVPKSTQEVVVQYEAQGFVTQSILVKVSELSNITANLLAAKEIVPVDDIAIGQVIKAGSLGATITIPADAFTDAKGRLVQGKVNVEFTPWDITSSDLNAMPANGFALDAQGNRTQLISAGMITATFKDAATGEKLQLASGKTADIQMDLPLKSINNQEMKIGTEIPMWHFDEAKGLWVEEGKGHVVASTTSGSGLAVYATVSHFSTWNWDFKFENAGSVFIQCKSDGQAIPCYVVAKVKLDDGSGFTNSTYISIDGTKAYNMPSSGSIQWEAKDSTGTMIGEKVSGTSGNVIIDLGKPTTDNFVQCKLPNGSATPCTGTLNQSYQFSASPDGAKIITGLKSTNNQLEWKAQSKLILEDSEWVRYSGEVISTNTGNIDIRLNHREVIFTFNNEEHFKLEFTCKHEDYEDWMNQNGVINEAYLGKKCDIDITVETEDARDTYTYQVDYGKPTVINIPAKYSGFVKTGTGNISNIQVHGQINNYDLGEYFSRYVWLENEEDISNFKNLPLNVAETPSPVTVH